MLSLYGINVSGGDFGSVAPDATKGIPFGGLLDKTFTYQKSGVFRYWLSTKKLNLIRYPIKWERAQKVPGGDLDATFVKFVNDAIKDCTYYGAQFLIDLHNYGGRALMAADGVTMVSAAIDDASGLVTRAHFADFWGRIAKQWGSNPLLAYDLMNEPKGLKFGDGSTVDVGWARACQAAIDAIRTNGGVGPIYIEAPDWAKPGALIANPSLLKLVDPLNKLVYEIHQYLDSGEQGDEGSLSGNDVQFGVKKLQAVTDYARKNGIKLFLGEFGIPPSTDGYTAVDNMLTFMEQNSDCWTGFSAWGGGTWWGSTYHYRLEQTNGADNYALAALAKHIPAPAAGGVDQSVVDALNVQVADLSSKLNAAAAAAALAQAQVVQVAAERDAAVTDASQAKADATAVKKIVSDFGALIRAQ